MSKRILFLSAIDFKEKSIQVIRKTPEAYVEAGWSVQYVVARDAFRRGNYSYEPEINPEGMQIERFHWPLARLRNMARGRWSLYFWTRLASFLVVLKLALHGARALRDQPVDVIYGYEVQGVLAVRLLRFFRRTGSAKIVSRFQGTCYITDALERRQIVRLIRNIDHVIALRAPCDLAIMTNDGTRGNETMRTLRSPAVHRLRFWVNGTDVPVNPKPAASVRAELGIPDGAILLLSVSRLVPWKRVDRGLAIAASLAQRNMDFAYVIVGGGDQRDALENRANELGIGAKVKFTGPVPQANIFDYVNAADVFLSTYDLSNVGNPLLEAIRMGKIVVTLNNGDTGSWITHNKNGFIYDLPEDLPAAAGRDIARLASEPSLRDRLEAGVRELARERLWTWHDRMRAELTGVEKLVET